MLSLSAVAKAEKNNLNSDGVFVILMELDIPMADVDPIRVCRNTEDIEWNGHTWQAFPFELDKVSEDKSGSIPSFEIRIDNTSQALTYYVEASNGANNGEVVFYIVNTKALTVTTAEVEEHYRITKLTVTEQRVTATVGTAVVVERPGQAPLTGHAMGLGEDGSLLVRTASGAVEAITAGDVRLRSGS